MKYDKENFKNLSNEELITLDEAFKENWKKAHLSFTDVIKKNLPKYLKGWDVKVNSNNIYFIRKDNNDNTMEICFRFERDYDYINNEFVGKGFQFKIDSIASKGSFDLINIEENGSWLYYKTIGDVIQDKTFINFLSESAKRFYDGILVIKDARWTIELVQNDRKAEAEKKAGQEKSQALYDELIPQLTIKENKDCCVIIAPCNKNEAIVTYRNKPYTLIPTISDFKYILDAVTMNQRIRNSDYQKTRPLYGAVVISMLRDARTGTWLNK